MAQLMQQKAQEAMKTLHDGAKIEVLDENIKRSIQDAAVRGETAPLEDEDEPGSEDESLEHRWGNSVSARILR